MDIANQVALIHSLHGFLGIALPRTHQPGAARYVRPSISARLDSVTHLAGPRHSRLCLQEVSGFLIVRCPEDDPFVGHNLEHPCIASSP